MKKTGFLWLLVLGSLSGDDLVAADWPRFRGPHGAATTDETGLPLAWSDSENIVWKTPLPGFGASSPIHVKGRVFVTAYSGYGLGTRHRGRQEDLRLHLVCVNPADGKILWDKNVPARLPEREYQRFLPEHGYASSTPTSDGEAVYAFFGRTGVFAFDFDGDELWRKSVGSDTHSFGSANSPILYENLLIVNASVESDSLIALDKTSGDEVWRARGMKRSWNSPALVRNSSGKHEVVVNTEGKILAYNAKTGESLWTCEGIDDYLCPDVLVQDGLLYVTGGRRPPKLIAVRPGGKGDVTESRRLWVTEAGSKIATPVYHDGHLYWVEHNGFAVCVNAGKGEIVYRERLKGAGKTYASAVQAEGRLYVVSCHNGTFVLDARPEFKVLAHNVFAADKSTFNATPAVLPGGKLLLRSDRYLYCVGGGTTARAGPATAEKDR